MFGLVLLAPRTVRFAVIWATVLLSVATLYAFGGIDQTRELAVIRCTYSFFVGVLTYVTVRSLSRHALKLRLGAPVLAVTVALICLPQYFPWLLLPPLFSACIATLVLENQTSPLKWLLSRPGIVYMGTISYGIHMIHAGIWETINIVLIKGLNYPLTTDGARVALTSSEHTIVLVVGMTIIIVGSHVSYHLIENRWRRR